MRLFRDVRRLAAWALFPCAAMLLAWPLRHGAPLQDDYLFLALGRHLEAPWPLLLQDSTGTYFFRPVVMAIWWGSVELLGIEGGPHLALNITVHAANGAAITGLLRRLGITPAVSLAAGLLFVVHPTTYAAACWLSDRFDLFATLFGVLAVTAFEAHTRRPSIQRLGGALALLALALFSKEVAFAFAACAFILLITRGGWRRAWRLEGRASAVAGIMLLCIVALAIRHIVLRDASSSLLGSGVLAVVTGGITTWFTALPDALVVRHGAAAAWASWLVLLAALVVGGLLLALRREPAAPFPSTAAWGGVLLVMLAVIVQTPVVHATRIVPFTSEFHFEALAASRFFYVPFAGLVAVLAGLADAASRASRPRLIQVQGLAAVIVFLALGVTSRTLGANYVRFVGEFETPAHAEALRVAMSVIDAPAGCKLYFLGAPSLPFRAFIDSGVKAGLPPRHSAMGCFVATEHTPWYNLVRAEAAVESSSQPLETFQFNGHPYAPLRVGNLAITYLNATNGTAIAADPAARFHAWRGGRFVEVTDLVRSGALEPRFYANR